MAIVAYASNVGVARQTVFAACTLVPVYCRRLYFGLDLWWVCYTMNPRDSVLGRPACGCLDLSEHFHQLEVDDDEDVTIESDSPPPGRAELQGLQGGRHPELSLESDEVSRLIRHLHAFDTATLAVHAVGASQVLGARLASWECSRSVPAPTLESEVAVLADDDRAHKVLLGVVTPAITRLLAVEYLLMRRSVTVNSDYIAARLLFDNVLAGAPVRPLSP